jgi:hypothetical protein
VTTVVQTWSWAVTFDGVPLSCLSGRVSHGVDQSVGLATLTTTKVLADTVSDGADVVVTATINGSPMTLFTGAFRSPERNTSLSGNLATLTCEGPNYRMTYPLEKDVVFAGGARTTAASLQTAAMHIGNDSISWYADPSPNGLSVDRTVTPLTDSNFAWIAGRLHGTNSYPTSLDDKKIKQWSRVEMWQAGEKRGFANFPENSERYNVDDPTDFTDDANWSDFELMIAGEINVADGDLTFRFISGTKPGSGQRDEYEVKNVTWQTAGQNTVRSIIRGMKKRSGVPEYRVNEITDIDGNLVYLGGNGLADGGQVRVSATETPLGFIQRIADLFGYKDFDCADGITRCIPIRGTPHGTVVGTFTEGENIISVRRSYDPSNVYNRVRVEGWSGTDQDRKRVEYASQTALVDVVPSVLIPTPPGISLYRTSDALLTSNGLCADVRRVAEVNHAEAAVYLEWETWPNTVRPGQTVTVNAPSVGFSGELFCLSNEPDLSTSGFRCRMTGWAGGAEPFNGDDADDPDPLEVDDEPTDPRPVEEWLAYKPKGAYSNG